MSWESVLFGEGLGGGGHLGLKGVDLVLEAADARLIPLNPVPLPLLDELDDLQLETRDVILEGGVGHGRSVPLLRLRVTIELMATATPGPTPNPNAMRFALDVTLPGTISASKPEDAGGNEFLAAVIGIDGVASVFGTSDFVTENRKPGGDWDAIIPAVQGAAASYL